ncbi:hypothetical protein [Streptomyces sp. NPDC002265]|uniref:hypothetical protein n=1 Tax=Streptomyces sp. NPDC002265 TaxID=3154415 RepID=UPI0033210E2A
MKELAGDGVPVTVTCRVLKLARQPYYRWLERPVTDAEFEQATRANALSARSGTRFCVRLAGSSSRAARAVGADDEAVLGRELDLDAMVEFVGEFLSEHEDDLGILVRDGEDEIGVVQAQMFVMRAIGAEVVMDMMGGRCHEWGKYFGDQESVFLLRVGGVSPGCLEHRA